MKITKRCKKCGSWAKPKISVSYTKDEKKNFLSFFEENYDRWLSGDMYIPYCIGANKKNKDIVIPGTHQHPCTLCEHGARTPGALKCAYVSACAPLAYFHLKYAQEWSKKQAAVSFADFGIKLEEADKTKDNTEEDDE